MLTVDEIVHALGLKPHPTEGGYFRETYRSDLALPSGILPEGYVGDRIASTAIYYLLTPETYSALHLLPGEEIFHFYYGDAVEMLQLHPNGEGEIVRIGTDISRGQRPQVVVHGGSWQGSRLMPGGKVALMGATMAPGFEFIDYRTGVRDELAAKYPEFTDRIRRLTGEPTAT